MASPSKPEITEFAPTFKEIEDEVKKLSDGEIEKARKDFDNWLDTGCEYLIYETLEQQMANKLIKDKQKTSQQQPEEEQEQQH